ncbi:MAG: EAL domain-containing protein [Ilumatobacteraceae bacterium]
MREVDLRWNRLLDRAAHRGAPHASVTGSPTAAPNSTSISVPGDGANSDGVNSDGVRELLDALPDAVLILDREGRVLEVNDLALRLTVLTRNELIGSFAFEVLPRKLWPSMATMWEQVQRGEIDVEPVFPTTLPDGREVLLEAAVDLPLHNPDRVVMVLRDVTGRIRQAESLGRARERFRLAFHGAPTGMAISTLDTVTLLDVNKAFATMLGYEPADLVGRSVKEITHPDDWLLEPTIVRSQDGSGDNFRMDKRYLRADGGVVWARTWLSLTTDGAGAGLAIAHIEDVTEQRHGKERLEWAATHDALTGLPNRFHFLANLGSRLEAGPPGSVAVLFIDLDNFKVINDSLGHTVGDQLLQGMSERLRAIVRDRDMLSRFGGDEFLVMLAGDGSAMSPGEVAERIRVEVAKPLMVDGVELYVTASIGITTANRPGVSTTELLRDADAAMYRAKARGRDRVEVFAPGTHDATVLALRTTTELRRGLERDEILPYYQPIVRLDDGQLVGFEVLARWRHPDRGLLGPDQFLPMAEETGLLGDVGATVLRASISQLGWWREKVDRVADLSISVNVSVRQLMSSTFVEQVADALAFGGVPAGSLWLEITESALMSDVKAATVALRELRSLGLHLAVDDFGTGYSSLTYLKRFPVESIKVDRSFVSGLGIDAEDTTIVEAVVKLGHSLGLSVWPRGWRPRCSSAGCARWDAIAHRATSSDGRGPPS